MNATAVRLNTCGMPTTSAPDSVVFHVVGRSEAVISGMNTGQTSPTMKRKAPMRKRHSATGAVVGGSCVIEVYSLVRVETPTTTVQEDTPLRQNVLSARLQRYRIVP